MSLEHDYKAIQRMYFLHMNGKLCIFRTKHFDEFVHKNVCVQFSQAKCVLVICAARRVEII